MSISGINSCEFSEFKDEIVCEKCGESVNNLLYKSHLKTHKEKREETCQICFKKFTNLSNFKYHMSHHSQERPWICNECPKRYKTKIDLIQHKRTHDRAKESYSCEICCQKFTIQSKYNTHLKTHSVKVKGPQKCDICEKIFVNLRSHIQQVHEKLRNYKCSLCAKTFGKRSGLVRHTMSVHEKMKSWACDLCEKSFGEKTQLLRHRKIHFNNNNKKRVIVEKDLLKNEDVFVIENEKNCEANSMLEIEKIKDSNMNTIEVLDEYRYLLETELEKVYQCSFCSLQFKQKRYYQSHIKTVHNNSTSLKCSYCDELFVHRTQRLRHVRLKHPEVYEENINDSNAEDLADRSCQLCYKVFKKSKYLQIHTASVHNNLFECDFCKRKFSFKTSMERHIRAIHLNRRDFKCQEIFCEKSFRSRYELNEHINNIHAKIKRQIISLDSVTCDVCDKICSSKKALYSHKKLVHEGVKWSINFKCKICFEKFDTKYKKIKHLQQIHQNGQIEYRTCHVCSMDFKLFDDFKTHVESHENCFICLTCGHDFSDNSSLFIHQETHKKIQEELRQFICDICSHRLSTKSQLEIHMRKHSSQDYYVCDECGKSYKFIAPFLHHKLVHENKFDFVCSYCNKVFRKRRDKVLHEKLHSDDRPYKCQCCEKSFAIKPQYSHHMKTHQPKYFECKLCFQHESTLGKLKIHQINEHPEEFPYKCINCFKVFKVSQMFEDHKENCREKLKFIS